MIRGDDNYVPVAQFPKREPKNKPAQTSYKGLTGSNSSNAAYYGSSSIGRASHHGLSSRSQVQKDARGQSIQVDSSRLKKSETKKDERRKSLHKDRKRNLSYEDNQDSRRAQSRKKSEDEASNVSSSRSYSKPPKKLPPIVDVKTLEQSEIPERLKMGRCRPVTEFEKLNRIGEGTYGIVYRARDTADDEIVALKKVRMEKERDGIPVSSIREISLLFSLKHENIVDLRAVAVGQQLESLFLVMGYCQYDLGSLLDHMSKPFLEDQVKCLMVQVLRGLEFMHSKFIAHRDIKVSNLLLTDDGVLKIADFGLARSFGTPRKPSTPKVVTLWYRAPEVLFGDSIHTTAMDLWSAGCVLSELLLHDPLFPARNEIELIDKIIDTIGSPNETIWPGYGDLPLVKGRSLKVQPYNNLKSKFPWWNSEAGFRLLNNMLAYCPSKRITAAAALKHQYFRENPLPCTCAEMPSFPNYKRQNQNDQYDHVKLTSFTTVN
ncbi:Oidioi.mRNA.OKI2018_I69.XSR.g14381.t1.cds [Oikopleura dioica]|uniref:Oidioi.mRNA.OKI2018_I69.XSR.g14381.t1.cds n=1 Tax=Oikopleura dioica TaxID=34765 RepID=A0ABN7SEV9_OIKDI|nr:Oidioi.mRNA.OKI2018_I69.XSR.g14381.t1.cds [Oikopleura dioica]